YSAKILPALSGICSILLTYLLGCELEGMLLGAIAAVFLAADNMFIFASRTARPEAVTVAMMLLGILLFLYARRRRSVGLAFLSGLVVGMAGQSHPAGLAAALIAGILAWQEFGLQIVRRARPWAFALGLILSFV